MIEIDKRHLFTIAGARLFLNLPTFSKPKKIKKKQDETALHYDGAVLKIGTWNAAISRFVTLAARRSVGRVLTGDRLSSGVLFAAINRGLAT